MMFAWKWSASYRGARKHLMSIIMRPRWSSHKQPLNLREQAEPLKLRVKRAWLVTEALDFLREIGSSYLPLRVQASTGVIAAISAAAKHQAWTSVFSCLACWMCWHRTWQRCMSVYKRSTRG